MAKQDSAEPKLLNLALQGGGAHGAFSWGVPASRKDRENQGSDAKSDLPTSRFLGLRRFLFVGLANLSAP